MSFDVMRFIETNDETYRRGFRIGQYRSTSELPLASWISRYHPAQLEVELWRNYDQEPWEQVHIVPLRFALVCGVRRRDRRRRMLRPTTRVIVDDSTSSSLEIRLLLLNHGSAITITRSSSPKVMLSSRLQHLPDCDILDPNGMGEGRGSSKCVNFFRRVS
ncbi:hypothetical protein SCHPADRAFT_452248 [Schizopora paradoxa]|uniref:Uncharacterized protein n=1 Tax=Schizopora paradoxa TaxID=27342 RepID=A0A0H2S4G3_9AGAM|nr:hypothetical protein SCHPADRAFT_452248 [Schizopora paradoxa]